MNILRNIGIAISGLFAFSTVVCGASISQLATIDPSSIQFHMSFAAITLIASFGTIALMIYQSKKR